MEYISRSQWYRQKIEDFLKSDELRLHIDLYSSEVKRIQGRYYSQLSVSVGPPTKATVRDQRNSCIIHKKRML